MGCYIWYSEEGPGRVTANPLTASVPIAVLLYDGPLLCGFNVAIKRLRYKYNHTRKARSRRDEGFQNVFVSLNVTLNDIMSQLHSHVSVTRKQTSV